MFLCMRRKTDTNCLVNTPILHGWRHTRSNLVDIPSGVHLKETFKILLHVAPSANRSVNQAVWFCFLSCA